MTIPNKFIGLIGLGYWGKNILRNLYELGVLNTACDTDPDIIAQKKNQFPNVEYTTSFRELLQHPDIKAIAIAAPAVAHFDLTRQALLAGKDVFVEKPLALTAREGEDLVKLAESENRILMVGHILQYHPAVKKLKELISAGGLGKMQYIYSNRLNIGKLRLEENILWSFALHDISVILMLLEEEPLKVSAFGGYYISPGIYDTTMTTLEFNNGIKGHIFVNWLHPFKEQKLIVVGSQAMAVFDDVSEDKLRLYPHNIEWVDGKIPVEEKAAHESIALPKEEPLKAEMEHFIQCVLKRERPKTDGREGLRVLRVLEAAQTELTKGKLTSPKAGLPYFVHDSAYVDENVQIGAGTKVWHFSHILKNSVIGDKCNIGQNVVIGPDVTIGKGCKIQNNVSVYPGVTLEDEVFCGPSMVFTNVFNPRAHIPRMDEVRPTLVKTGATIGANATIVCGNTIGRYAFIGAGTVVTKDIPDYALVVGSPGRQQGWMCACGNKLNAQLRCEVCTQQYEKEGAGLRPLIK